MSKEWESDPEDGRGSTPAKIELQHCCNHSLAADVSESGSKIDWGCHGRQKPPFFLLLLVMLLLLFLTTMYRVYVYMFQSDLHPHFILDAAVGSLSLTPCSG